MENLNFFVPATSPEKHLPKAFNVLQTSRRQRDLLLKKFSDKLQINHSLDRTLVSFQANRVTPFFNWFKYREGFSANLIRYILEKIPTEESGVFLDPFAGSGTALFEAAERGWHVRGIELLPVGLLAIKARSACRQVDPNEFKKVASSVLKQDLSRYYDELFTFRHIPITLNAFPQENERDLVGYRSLINKKYADNPEILTLLELASFSILEEISFTRKDGQYLRWDSRSGRSIGTSTFDKGKICNFREAITGKLNQIGDDLLNTETDIPPSLFANNKPNGPKKYTEPEVLQGSCLNILPTLDDSHLNLIITSPPYCNRYDYTRTYALELVYLGANAEAVKNYRQALLSCTVENREKISELENLYTKQNKGAVFHRVKAVFDNQEALQEVLANLNEYAAADRLNNPNIVKMVRNYFFELSFTIREMARMLVQGGKIFMVNDNVQYAGEEIPVDLILSDIAEQFGLKIEVIWVLPRGKGNSSQQMGDHGRSELRKCVYLWRKV